MKECDDEYPDTPTGARHQSELSIGRTLEILTHRDRRYVLSYLTNAPDDVATIDQLADYIVRSEIERVERAPNHDRVESSLYEIHLPQLISADLVEYDSRSRQLRYWGDERLEEWLEQIEREERS